jgi:hypothetical protein
MLPKKEDDEREDQAEADGEREWNDGHGGKGLRREAYGSPAPMAPHSLHKMAQNLAPNSLDTDDLPGNHDHQ